MQGIDLERNLKVIIFGKKEEIGDSLSISLHRKRNREEEKMFLFRELCYSKLVYTRESR